MGFGDVMFYDVQCFSGYNDVTTFLPGFSSIKVELSTPESEAGKEVQAKRRRRHRASDDNYLGKASETVWYVMVLLWCGVVWCGVVWWGGVWCGVVWCGVVWCGVVWCGVVWCGVVWCGVVWCGVVWCGVVWCGVVWCGVVWCGVVWCGVVWCGVVWCGVVWCGVVWCGVVWCGVVWCGVVWCGVVWCGVVWCGVVWYGMVRCRSVWYNMLNYAEYFFSISVLLNERYGNILNGGYYIKAASTNIFRIAGLKITYSGSRSYPEFIKIQGKLTQKIRLQVSLK